MKSRRLYLDWARGVAVLLMIEAHTFDAWTQPAVRATQVFRNATILGGFAAPLFLWLAGVGVAMAAASTARRYGRRSAGVDVVCRRGLEIFILAFLFRLQAFIVSPGSHPVTLFRVDILNIIGPSIAIAAVIWGLIRDRAALVGAYAALACLIAMVTPIVRTSTLVGALPIWVQWYVRPFGDLTMFTAFPWAGFVFAGAGCGVLIDAARDSKVEQHLHACLALAGVAILALGQYMATLPSIYRQSSFWTSSPTYFAVRVGILLAGVSLIYALARALEPHGIVLRPLARLGRDSLFVYWIHVELVYGYATWPIRHRLPIVGTLVAYGVFTVLVYGAVIAKDRLVEVWRARGARPETAPLTA